MKELIKGVMGRGYHLERKAKLAPKYRLKRRGYEVIEAIRKYGPPNATDILDIGTADGLMLGRIKKEFPTVKCLGLEYSQELINMNRDKNIEIIQGDAQNMPFKDESFDIAIAAAVIEHLNQPVKMLREAHRILRPGGILILTTPNPLFEKIADLIGHFEKNIHQETFALKKLKKYFLDSGFKILETKRFMISPIGLPFELKIEKIIRFLKLDFIFLNQLIVGKKINV